MDFIDPRYSSLGFVVGALVGMTGVGGGSLMTPLLILLFGIAPATAVGTDLLHAAASKSVGSVVHGLHGTIDWRVVRRLASGSVPATILSLLLLAWLDMETGGARRVITAFLIVALFLTALAMLTRDRIASLCSRWFRNPDSESRAIPTVLVGAFLGVLVSISSVGAGAIGVTALFVLYPRLATTRIVGSDIAHAVPLTLVAGLGHELMGSVDWHVMISLLAGSLPGIFIGSSVSARIPDKALRIALAGTLLVVVGKLALSFGLGQPSTVASSDPTTQTLHEPSAGAPLHR